MLAMPNGGPDNCANCGFNRRNRGIWRNPSPDEQQAPFCEIRKVPVIAEHWTYCQNWHSRTQVPVGPVYASGLYEDRYQRIPWHGNIEPETAGPGVCSECGRRFVDGLQIAVVEAAVMQFCCNRHYLAWWKKQHPNEDAPMSRDIWEDNV